MVVESLPGLETLEMEGPLARPRGSYYLEDWEEFGESPLEVCVTPFHPLVFGVRFVLKYLWNCRMSNFIAFPLTSNNHSRRHSASSPASPT